MSFSLLGSHPRVVRAVGLMGALAVAWSCTDKEEDTAGPVVPGVPLADANNYSFSGLITVPTVTTATETDLQICWDDLTSDLQCHGVDPAADIDNIALVRMAHLSQSDVELGLSGAGLQQADISGYVEVPNETGTCAQLADMTFFGTEVDVPAEYNVNGGTYLLLLTTGTEPGVGARMLTFLEPSESSTETSVTVADGCGMLEYTVDLESLTRLSLPAEGPWEVNWATVGYDGQGFGFDPNSVDQIWLANFESLSVDELESQFLDLELIADQLYTADITAGNYVDLATATQDGQPFTGFNSAGQWVLALRCSRCQNPAPLFLTFIDVTTGGR